MIRFNCDYCEGAHERILRKLAETNLEQTPGYGEDHYCAEAAGIIRSLCGQDYRNAQAEFQMFRFMAEYLHSGQGSRASADCGQKH